ncbi:hypothetical protein Flav3CDRAFT_1198 [Flavobacteria bacterium MS024-3C]|nr:hypothetical protein Flav3CDRAFT_1198 [Flavobacteria bacterium MS024-3C]
MIRTFGFKTEGSFFELDIRGYKNDLKSLKNCKKH